MLYAALALSFTACSGSEAGEETHPPTESSGQQTTEPSITSEETGPTEAEPEDSEPKDPIVILDNEYERALWYGFLPDGLADADPDSTTVTWKQYCAILGAMIGLMDESKLPEWDRMTADAPEETILRDGAAMANLFAAKVTGLDYCSQSGGLYSSESYNWGENFSWDYPIFDWQQPCTLCGQDTFGDQTAIAATYFYNLGRVSCISAEPMLTCDENGDPHFLEALTLRDALISVTQFYESVEDVAIKTAEKLLAAVLETEEGRALTAQVEQRKAEIIHSATAIVKSDEFVQGETYTGTAYYVSNNGDDSNDGLTPETPFATLERLGDVSFAFGDTVFFERGSIWRKAELPMSLIFTEGITLSAYGEGDKPRFYGSSENGSGAEKWTLFYSGENGEKIWKYYHEITDCPAVIGPDDTLIAVRDLFYWDGSGFYVYENTTQEYDMTKELKNDEMFLDLPYEEGQNPERIYAKEWDSDAQRWTYLTDPLYVRLDEGNPGELYDSIEFIEAYALEKGTAEYITLDNLDIRYSGTVCLGGSSNGNSVDHIIAQNCVVSWCGGLLNYFRDGSGSHFIDSMYGTDSGSEPGGQHVLRRPNIADAFIDGGALNTNGSYETIRDCYVHHCFQEGLALETFADNSEMCESVTITGNVSEYCMFGLTVINWDAAIREDHLLKNISVTDNYVMYSGFENYYCWPTLVPPRGGGFDWDWLHALGTEISGASAFPGTTSGPNASDGTYSVSNNTFAFSIGNLVNTTENKGNRKRFLDPESAMEWIHDEDAAIITFGY